MRKMMVMLLAMLMGIGISSAVYALPYGDADIVMAGKEYSGISALGTTTVSGGNEWYVEGDSIWTAWSGQWVEYTAELETAGTWNIGLNAINHGNLGDSGNWYTEFRLSNSLTNETIQVPASDDEEFFGFVQMDLNPGTYTVRYTWLNDKYDPPLDANIEITSVFFDDINTPVPEPATLLLLGAGLAGMAGIRRRVRKP